MITLAKEGNRYWWTAADGQELCFTLKQGKWKTPDNKEVPYNAEVAEHLGNKKSGCFKLQITYWIKTVNISIIEVDYCSENPKDEFGWEEETIHNLAKYTKEEFAKLDKANVIAWAYEQYKVKFGHLIISK
jgi:hypothetical protein